MKTRKLLFLCLLPAVALLIMGAATIRKFSFYEHAPALDGTEILPMEIPGQSPPYDYTTLAEIRTFATNGLNPLPFGGKLWFGTITWTELDNARLLGTNAGQFATNSTGANFIGPYAGQFAFDSDYSTFLGSYAGQYASEVRDGHFLGSSSGQYGSNSPSSIFVGPYSGQSASNSPHAVVIGPYSGQYSSGSTNAILIGREAGRWSSNIVSSIFIGPFSGTNRARTLWIDSMATVANGSYQPLIYGEFDNRMLKFNGSLTVTGAVNAGIGSLTVAAANTNAAFDCASELQHVHVTAGNVAIEGFANVPAFPLVARVSMTVSNGTAAAIAFFNTAANARMIGSVTSNGIQIASTKMLEVDLKVCSAFTNWAAAAQQ